MRLSMLKQPVAGSSRPYAACRSVSALLRSSHAPRLVVVVRSLVAIAA